MVQNGLKVSLYNDCPIAIIADLDIMKQAPLRMLMAGLGDVLAKCVALCDWRIAEIVVGEAYCEPLAQLMRFCVQKCLDNAEGLMRREPEAVRSVIEGLVLSGIAMAFAGSSRPASGLEHYFSHMWEMVTLQRHMPTELHGIQVGVGTCLCLPLYQHLRTVTPDKAQALGKRAAFSQAKWEEEMTRIFKSVAPSIINGERNLWHKNDADGHAKRLAVIIDRWDDIVRSVVEELPDADATIARLKSLYVPTTPQEIGFSHEDTIDAFVASREIRNKYLVSSLLWDIGLLDEFTQYL
jgi:glycerol-1-phosphate dehydrogenase [NAD(P)+]